MRTKIIAGNLAAVLVVGLVSYAMVKSSLETALVDEVDSRIGSDFQLLQRSFRLSARDLAELVHEQAEQRAMADTFLATLDETSRRTRAYEAADRTAAWLTDPSRRGGAPDIVAVIDDRGLVVARNADRNRMYQQDLRAVQAVARALRGETATGIWQKEDEQKVLQIAVAPIQHEGRILGVLLVGYDVSNALARSEGQLLGRDVAFVLGDRVYSGSLDEGGESEALRGHLFGEHGQAATQAALQQGTTGAPFRVHLGDDEYVGVIGPAPGAQDGGTPLAMVVLADRSAQAAKASATNVILMLTVLGALIVLVYGFLIGTSFIRPIEQMEEGILAVINGRTDLRIDLESAEYGGLVYRINQLLNVFTGTPEEDEQGRVSAAPGQRWDEGDSAGAPAPAAAPAADAGGGAGAAEEEDPALAAQLAAEPEDAYYARVYREYVAAKQAAGEDVSNIPQDKFVQRLRANEQGLMKKHNCRMVRFQVQTRGTQVNLKPVVIR